MFPNCLQISKSFFFLQITNLCTRKTLLQTLDSLGWKMRWLCITCVHKGRTRFKKTKTNIKINLLSSHARLAQNVSVWVFSGVTKILLNNWEVCCQSQITNINMRSIPAKESCKRIKILNLSLLSRFLRMQL